MSPISILLATLRARGRTHGAALVALGAHRRCPGCGEIGPECEVGREEPCGPCRRAGIVEPLSPWELMAVQRQRQQRKSA